MTTCLAHTRGVARPPSAWKRARDDASHAPGGVGKPRRADDRFFTTPRAGTCHASGGWHAKPSRAKGRGSRPSPASMLMSLLTSNVDAGDDGASSSSLSGEASGSVASSASGPGSPVKSRIPEDRVATHPKLRTVSGEPVRAFALGGNRETRQRSDVVTEAYARGVNYFFAYSMDDASIGDYLDGLRVLCSDPRTRRRIFVAVGMEDFTDREKVTDHVAKCLARLGTDYVDAFYMEYVCRGDEDAAIDAVEWMRGEGGLVVADRPGARAGIDGPVRFVGCSTHDRCVGVKLLRSERRRVDAKDATNELQTELQTEKISDDERSKSPETATMTMTKTTPSRIDDAKTAETASNSSAVSSKTLQTTCTDDAELASEFANAKPCALDFLMARYNMAHAKAEWRLFPVALARDVPVVAFTTTRWNSLQKGHPRWDGDPPSTATCMRWAEAHPAVQVVLNSAPDVAYLGEWADELSDERSNERLNGETETGGYKYVAPPDAEMEKWRAYGELVYYESAAFETLF